MKKSLIVFAALIATACGSQPNHQNYDQQPQQTVARDGHTDAIVAGALAGAAGYAVGRYANSDNGRRYDERRYDDRRYDERRSYRPSTPTYRAPSAPTRSYAPSRPTSTRSMFKSARRR